MKIFIFLFLTIPLHVYSQQGVNFKGYVVYGEVLGAGMGPTVNFERTFSSWNRWFVTARAGTGYYRWEGGRKVFFSLPVGLSLFSHTGHSHKEIGINLTYAEGISHHYTYARQPRGRAIYFIPSAGYRFQKPDGGLFLRVNYTPYIKVKEFNSLIEKYNTTKTVHLLGISVGYYFREKTL